jgi:hypothetical protein
VVVTARVSKPLCTLTIEEIEANKAPATVSLTVW